MKKGFKSCGKVILSLTLVFLTAFLLIASPFSGIVQAAQTIGNGSLIYSPPTDSTVFDKAGTTYAKIICLKHNGSANGTLLVTYDQLVWVNGVQVYPIYKSTNSGNTWTHLTDIVPSKDFPNLIKTSQPFLYELPQAVGSLSAGTLLFAGNIMPADKSSTNIVLYKSTDQGKTWTYLSTVDKGGPATYDPSPTSTTTSVWEPSLNIDKTGNLVCYFSDERQKSNNILQAVSYRESSDGGKTWNTEGNVAAVPNKSDRPGMITVTKLPNGKYMAAYEVVNRPSQSLNTAVVYCKFSDDGITWNASDLGNPVKLSNGRGIGSSPYIKWVPAGGPNGMVIVSSKWALDSFGNESGGQNFYVNYNLGQGNWERLPYAITYDANDTQGGYFSGFAQAFDTSADGLTLYQATNVENPSTGHNDIRVGSIPLNQYQYEAENATTNDVKRVSQVDAVNGSKIGNINYSDSYVKFNVNVPTAGTYTVNVRYDNGTGSTSSHFVSVNGGTNFTVSYAPTVDWNRYQWTQFTCNLNAGANTIKFSYNGTYAELDSIFIFKSAAATNGQFKIVNRNSGLYIEVYQASIQNSAKVDQWSNTGNPCQIWSFAPTDSGFFKIANVNSGKLMETAANGTSDGTSVDQYSDTGALGQQWNLVPTDSGYYKLQNRNNTDKLLEVYQNSVSNGANINIWGDTGYNCQQWTLIKEGIQ